MDFQKYPHFSEDSLRFHTLYSMRTIDFYTHLYTLWIQDDSSVPSEAIFWSMTFGGLG